MWCIYLDIKKLNAIKDGDLKVLLSEVNKHSGGWYLQENIEDSWWRTKKATN